MPIARAEIDPWAEAAAYTSSLSSDLAARKHRPWASVSRTTAAYAAATVPIHHIEHPLNLEMEAEYEYALAMKSHWYSFLRLGCFFLVISALMLWMLYSLGPWRVWFRRGVNQLQGVVNWRVIATDVVNMVLDLIKAIVICLFWPVQFAFAVIRSIVQYIIQLLHPEVIFRFVAKFVARAVNSAARATMALIRKTLLFLRYNQLTDAILFQYHQTMHWFGRNKWLILVICWLLWVSSVMIEREQAESYMSWREFQAHHSSPLPPVLLQTRKEYGSNSHYQPESHEWLAVPGVDQDVVEDAQQPVVGESVPAAQSYRPVSERAGASPTTITFVGDSMVFCMRCQQWHCCELPY